MRRIIFVLGTWQLIQASAALRQESSKNQLLFEDTLVLYGDGLPEEMKASMKEMSSLTWDWEKVIWADKILTISNCYSNITYDLFASLREHIGVAEADEIWVCKLFNPLEKIVADAYPKSRIVLYEDGLHLFVPQKKYDQGFNLSFLFHPLKLFKYIASERNYNKRMLRYTIKGVWRNHIERVKRIYLFASKQLAIPKYLEKIPAEQIDAGSIISTIDVIKFKMDTKVALKKFNVNTESKSVLVLAQSFSKGNKYLKKNDELRAYKVVVEKLIHKGYNVYWKEHPRTEFRFYPVILNHLSQSQEERFIELDIPFTMPVELFIQELDIVGCISCTSTSLFHLPDLFGIPTYTMVDYFSRFKNKDFRIMANFAKKYIQPVAAMISESRV